MKNKTFCWFYMYSYSAALLFCCCNDCWIETEKSCCCCFSSTKKFSRIYLQIVPLCVLIYLKVCIRTPRRMENRLKQKAGLAFFFFIYTHNTEHNTHRLIKMQNKRNRTRIINEKKILKLDVLLCLFHIYSKRDKYIDTNKNQLWCSGSSEKFCASGKFPQYLTSWCGTKSWPSVCRVL